MTAPVTAPLVDRLAGALEDLVRINVEHNEAVAAVIGRPLDWKDAYLFRARALLDEWRESKGTERKDREARRWQERDHEFVPAPRVPMADYCVHSGPPDYVLCGASRDDPIHTGKREG